MSLFKRIVKVVKEEISKPTSFVKGEDFENYVRETIFPKDSYKLLNRTHNYQTNKSDFVDNSLMPDFELQCLETKQKFYVEVKFRQGVYSHKDKIEWCKPYQLKRYKSIDKDKKVFLALGIGDNPKKPKEVFVIPLSSINFCDFYDSFLDRYSFYLDKSIFPSYLWKLGT